MKTRPSAVSAVVIAVLSLTLGACAPASNADSTVSNTASSTGPAAADLSTPERANASIYAMLKAGDRQGMHRALSTRVAATFATDQEFGIWFEQWRTALRPEDARKPLRLVEEGGTFKLDEK